MPDTTTETLPMFPLGTVLLPGMLLPLHVFEPRYRELTRDVLAADRRFGVVLIERGHEVGGDDLRADVGTIAEVIRAEELDDGRWLLIGVGTARCRVVEWLDDDPYPRAVVSWWPDPAVDVDPDVTDRVSDRLQRVVQLTRELGQDVPEVQLDPDPLRASYQAAIIAQIGPMDAQALLRVPDASERLARLADLLQDQEEILRFRLQS